MIPITIVNGVYKPTYSWGAHIVSGMIGTLSLARPFLLLEIHRTAMETWLT